MNISGLKALVREAYQSKKFLTNGQTMPDINFDEPLLVEVTAKQNSGLFSVIQIEDDEIVSSESAYARQLVLQMIDGCAQQNAILKLITDNLDIRQTVLKDVTKIRICITGFTAHGKKPFRVPSRELKGNETTTWHRKLVPETIYILRAEDLVAA
jgi:hypothetical protein